MITFKVLIQKTVSWYPRYRQKLKWIEIALPYFQHAKVEELYPGWEVSMFWPK